MSGPKAGDVSLVNERAMELERIRREKLERIRRATEYLNIEFEKTNKQIKNFMQFTHKLINGIENTNGLESTVKNVKSAGTSFIAKLDAVTLMSVPTEPDEIFNQADYIAKLTNEVSMDFYRTMELYKQRIDSTINHVNAQSEIINRLKKENVLSIQIKDMSTSDVNFKEEAENICRDVEDLINSPSILRSDKVVLSAISKNIYESASKSKSSFEAAKTEFKLAMAKTKENIKLFDAVYSNYYAEYVLWLELINNNSVIPVEILPKEKFQFNTIQEMKKETELLAKESKALSEDNYIRRQIHDVMEEFGYNQFDEIILSESQLGSHYIHTGKTGAIHVHMSKDKKIMMEVVGTETISTPESFGDVNAKITGSSYLTEKEKSQMLEKQNQFCQLHPQIIEELRKRGVIFVMKRKYSSNLIHCKKIARYKGEKTLPAESKIKGSTLYNSHAKERKSANRPALNKNTVN